MSGLKRRRVDPQQGSASKKRPSVWGFTAKLEFASGRAGWALVKEIELDPITMADYANASKDDMVIYQGIVECGGAPDVQANDTDEVMVILVTTSQFPDPATEGIIPCQLITDHDVIMRTIVDDEPAINRAMQVIPENAEIVLVVPTVYVYAWMGKKDLQTPWVPQAVAPATEPVDPIIRYCSFNFSYKMTNLGPASKLDKYIEQSTNASFLELPS